MPLKKLRKNNTYNSIPNAFLNIVGRNMLQNELLLSFLQKETGLKGTYFPNLESISAIDANESAIPQLLILDYKNIDLGNLWTDIRALNCSNSSTCFFVVCNAEPDPQFEKGAMDNGIQGIFYNNDPLKLISKGVRAVLNGDLWYSRKTLKKILMEKQSLSNSLLHPAVSRLTGREKQVLSCIASGNTSKVIADELCISMHTVKTHIYNIYRKINATNRLQASLWTAKYL
ncbi:MAG: response regulator transcription factor [Thermodesulfobacteriota bacterium]|nr:response regulator transcription factor [Thermodesulfobacteriota bacterium]